MGCRFFQLADCFLHIFKVLVKLFNSLWIFLFLLKNLISMVFDIVLVNFHQSTYLFAVVFLLHDFLEFLNEILDLLLMLLCLWLSLLELPCQSLYLNSSRVNVLSKVIQGFCLHLEKFFKITQIGLQSFNRLFFRFKTCLHFVCSVGKNLFSFL